MDRGVTIPRVGLRLDPVLLWGLAFASYACASLLWSAGDWRWGFILLSSLIASYLAGRWLESTANVWFCFCLALCLGLISIYWFVWGIFGNPNILGCSMALGLAAALAYRMWAFLPPLIWGLWYSQSRGAILSASVVCLIAIWRRSKPLGIALGLTAIAVIVFVSDGRSNSIFARMGIWADTVTALTPWGHGWGSFFESYWALPRQTNAVFAGEVLRPPHAYNDMLELTFELGLGVIPLWVVILHSMLGNAQERLICWAFILCSLTFFPLHILPLGPLFAFALGHNSRSSKWPDGD